MTARFKPVSFSDRPTARRRWPLRLVSIAALIAASVGLLYQSGVRLVRIDTASSGGSTPALFTRSEVERIESQYQERLESLRAQVRQEREKMRESKRELSLELASILRTDTHRRLEALASDSAAREHTLRAEFNQSERALRAQQHKSEQQLRSEHQRNERGLQAQLQTLRQERDRLAQQRDQQVALAKKEQARIEQQYKKQLTELQRKLAGTVDRIAQIETAQHSLMRSLGVKSSDAGARPRGGQGGIYQPLDRPRPGSDSFESATASLREDLRLLDRGIAPIEKTWRDALLPLTQRPVALPIQEPFYISSHFGLRQDPMTRRAARHDGVDLVARHGTPVVATASGRVIRAAYSGALGQLIEIEHPNGYVTRYAHLSQMLVKSGQTVALGQMIGRVGRTGRATGVHLHFELLQHGKPIDPTRAFSQPLWAQHDRQSFSYR